MRNYFVCRLLLVLFFYSSIVVAQSNKGVELLTQVKINELFEKYGEDIEFKSSGSSSSDNKLRILVLKNTGNSLPKMTHSISFALSEYSGIGLDYTFTLDNSSIYRVVASTNYSKFLEENLTFRVRSFASLFHTSKEVSKMKSMNVTKYVKNASGEYKLSYKRKSWFRFGNYLGLEYKNRTNNEYDFYEGKYVLESVESDFLLHAGFDCNWFADYRVVFDNFREMVTRKSVESDVYFGLQSAFNRNNPLFSTPIDNENNFRPFGGLIGITIKRFNSTYKIDKVQPPKRFIFMGFEYANNIGTNGYSNGSKMSIRVGVGF